MLEKSRENKFRIHLRKHGYKIHKTGRYSPPGDMGGYMIINAPYGATVLGSQFELDLDDVEAFLKELNDRQCTRNG